MKFANNRTARVYDNTLLICGGLYGNWQAFQALLIFAAQRDIATANIIITGDLAAYCADGAVVAGYCRHHLPDTLIIRGNCERALAQGAEDCGCGFETDSLCSLLSAAWYRHAADSIDQATRQWMGNLPARADISFGGRRLAVIHGGATADNTFIFASDPDKRQHLNALQTDGVIAGHCGIPFSDLLDGGGLWHNSGALGMPANDGTARVWVSLWQHDEAGIHIRHCALDYDHAAAAAAMQAAGLPPHYRQTLANGIWPSNSILPAAEKQQQGQPLAPPDIVWEHTAHHKQEAAAS